MENMGPCRASHAVSEIHLDDQRRFVSTPAYMQAQSITEAASGIEKLVEKVVQMAG